MHPSIKFQAFHLQSRHHQKPPRLPLPTLLLPIPLPKKNPHFFKRILLIFQEGH